MLCSFLGAIYIDRNTNTYYYRNTKSYYKEVSNEFKEVFYDFGKALYHVDSFYDEFAKKSNVSSALLWVLYALNDGEPHTQIEISTDWELPKTTVNTVIKELKQKGYVELVPIKGKRREMSIVLTDIGIDYADHVLSDLYKMEKAVFERLSSEERGIIAVLDKIADCLKGENL